VDVENLRRDLDYQALMSRVFAPAEIFALNSMPPLKQRNHFYSLWTMKEAYIKARGMGLSLPLDGFWFDLEGTAPRVQFSERCADTPAHRQFFSFEPTPEHALALAVLVPSRQSVSARIHWTIPLSAMNTARLQKTELKDK
jgi:4'-phosphopantetheinyl transferase